MSGLVFSNDSWPADKYIINEWLYETRPWNDIFDRTCHNDVCHSIWKGKCASYQIKCYLEMVLQTPIIYVLGTCNYNKLNEIYATNVI